MSELDTIIEINITRQTTTVDTAAFNIPLIVSGVIEFPERTRTYNSLAAVGDDFSTSSNVYIMASKVFAQNPRPTSIIVGRRQIDSVTGVVNSVVVGQVYSVTVSGEEYTYTAQAGDTVADVVAGIEALYDVSPVTGVTFVDNLDGTFAVSVSTLGSPWSVSSSSNVILTGDAPTESWAATFDAIDMENDTWYAATSDAHNDADILAIAAAIETRRKIYVTSSDDVDITGVPTTDILGQLEALNYARTSLIYLPTANTEFPEAALVGKVLPYPVGSASWNFKSLSGVTASKLSATQITNISNKNGNWYTTLAGVPSLREGLAVDGRPIYEITISDFITARMQEQIYGKMVRLPKLPLKLAA